MLGFGMMIVLVLLPAVVFVAVDMFGKPRTAVISAIVCALLLGGVDVAMTKEVSLSTFVEPVLILLMGLLSLRLNKPAVFKFQPVVVGVVLAALLAWYQYVDVPIFAKYLPVFAPLMPPEVKRVLLDPKTLLVFNAISGHLIYVVLAHAALVAWVALRFNSMTWLLARLAFYPLMAGLVIADFVAFS